MAAIPSARPLGAFVVAAAAATALRRKEGERGRGCARGGGGGCEDDYPEGGRPCAASFVAFFIREDRPSDQRPPRPTALPTGFSWEGPSDV